jgi:VanZ family protein
VSRPASAAWWAAFWVAVAVQLVVLYLPTAPGPPTGLPLDKVVHFAVFFAVAALGIRAGANVPWLIGLLVLQACASEVLQGTVLPARSADPWDVVADLAGIGAGWWVGRRWAGRQRQR